MHKTGLKLVRSMFLLTPVNVSPIIRLVFAHRCSTTYKSSVADPDPGSGAFLTPGSGMGRKSASGSGMNNPDHIF